MNKKIVKLPLRYIIVRVLIWYNAKCFTGILTENAPFSHAFYLKDFLLTFTWFCWSKSRVCICIDVTYVGFTLLALAKLVVNILLPSAQIEIYLYLYRCHLCRFYLAGSGQVGCDNFTSLCSDKNIFPVLRFIFV
jgi:hypothetical protein